MMIGNLLPHKRAVLNVILFAVPILIFSIFTVSSSAQNPTIVVFVVSAPDPQEPRSNMDVVAIFENGKFKVPYSEESEAAQQKFAREYFAPARKYHVTFGGGEVGTATVREHNTGCNNIHATVDVDAQGKIPVRLSGMATNSERIGRKPSARRPPTSEERASVMKLVKQIYLGRRTPASLYRTLKTTNVAATDLDGDGKFEMIGSFELETKNKFRRDLFLIAEPLTGTAAFKAGFVHFQSYKLIPEGFDSAVDFVDQLDVDGDGIGEVFAQHQGFDAYGYNVYKKINGRWREVLRTLGDAC